MLRITDSVNEEHGMSTEQLLALALASSILLALPGSANLAVMSYALGSGRMSAMAAALGTAAGATAVMFAALYGLVSLLALSQPSYATLEWIGTVCIALFLIRLIRGPLVRAPLADNDNMPARKIAPIFLKCLASTALSPRTILLFVSVFAQFVEVLDLDIAQAASFSVLFAAVSLSVAALYAMFAEQIFERVRAISTRRTPRRSQGKTRIGGGKVAFGYRRMAA